MSAKPEAEPKEAPKLPDKVPDTNTGIIQAILSIGAVMLTVGIIMLANWLRQRKITALEHGKRVAEDRLHQLNVESDLNASLEERKALSARVTEYQNEIKTLQADHASQTARLKEGLKIVEESRSWQELDDYLNKQ